jgi:hypothetical protein
MSIKLVFEPRKTVNWEQFLAYPPYSIAVDGYCAGRAGSSEDGLILNIDHHDECDRLATRSSCDQALCLVKMGLYETFRRDGKREATIYANDCDQDVALATYILLNPDHADRPKLKGLVRLEDLLDMSAGLYPIKRRWHLLRQLIWITEPYTQARASGALHGLDAEGMAALVQAMHRRIKATLFGRGKDIDLDTRFEVIAEHAGWQFIREIGQHARLGMGEKGIKAFAVHVADEGERHRYVIGRLSAFIPFPVPAFCEDLNKAEGIPKGALDRWGGAENIIGSPRQGGSSLSPDTIAEIVNARLAKARAARAAG